MMSDALLVVIFFTSAFLQVSFFPALVFPLSAIPLHFILGVVILHRHGLYSGTAWFTLSGLFFVIFGESLTLIISFGLIALMGVILTKKIFTNRSLYALEGLGITLFLVFITTNLIWSLAATLISPASRAAFKLSSFLAEAGFGFLTLIILLYLGFFLARYLENLGRSLFLIRR